MATKDVSGADPREVMERFAAKAQRISELPVAFGGLVTGDQRFLTITALRGTLTNSLSNLRVRSGEGLGGKSLALRRPASVLSYLTARGITRRYDHAVLPEQLESILAVPIAVPGRDPVALLYLAHRQEVSIGDRVPDRLRPLVAQVAHELQLAVDVEARVEAVRRDLAVARVEERPDVRSDVQALMESTTDPQTRRGLEELLARLQPGAVASVPKEPSPLTQRETDVLRHAEEGASNREIGEILGLTEGTVKSYMKTAMAKVGSDNRVRAARTAREHGWLR